MCFVSERLWWQGRYTTVAGCCSCRCAVSKSKPGTRSAGHHRSGLDAGQCSSSDPSALGLIVLCATSGPEMGAYFAWRMLSANCPAGRCFMCCHRKVGYLFEMIIDIEGRPLAMERLLLIWGCLLVTSSGFAQDWLGNITDRHAGVLGVHVQPASLVSSPYSFDINVLGINAVGYNVDVVENLANFDVNRPNGFLRNEKNFLVRAALQLPSFTWKINDKNAVGLGIKSRSVWYTEDPDGSFVRMLMNDFEDRESHGIPFSNRTLSSHATWWTDFGGTYARSIWQSQKHRIDAGLTVKYVVSNASGYFRMDDLSFVLANADTIERLSGRLRFAFNNTLDALSDDKVRKLFNQSTWGLTLGLEYGFSPDGKSEKLRLGISVLDMGRLRYSSSSASGEYSLDGSDIAIHRFREATTLRELADVFKEEFGKVSLSRKDYVVYLPTQLSIQGDYHLTRDWYLNFSAYMPISGRETRINQNRNFASYLLTPRIEKDRWGLQLPIGYNSLSGFGAGFGARFGPLYIGSSNLIKTIFIDRDARRFHGYFGMRINRLWERKNSKRKGA